MNELQELYTNFQKSIKFSGVSENFVPGEGPTGADLFFIGEAPGQMEDIERRPFIGNSGEVFERLLESINVKREDVFVTNLFKYRPPQNRNPLPHEIKSSVGLLTQEIKIVKPKIVVPMGKYATSVFFPTERFSAARNSITKKGSRIIIPTFHPANILWDESGQSEKELLQGFKKISEVLKNGL